MTVSLTTARSAAEVTSAYAAQIAAAGWLLEFQKAESGAFAMLRARGTTAAGSAVSAVMTVTKVEDADRFDVVLRIVRNQWTSAAGASMPSPAGPRPPMAAGRAGGGGAAEAAAPTGISPALAGILFRGRGQGPGDDLRSGSPAGFPKDLLPAGVDAGATAISAAATTVVAEGPNFKITDLPKLAVDLRAAGWLNGNTLAAGFHGALPGSIPPFMLCRGGTNARMDLLARPGGGLFFRITLPSQPAECRQAPNFFADVTMPFLASPEGVSFPAGLQSGGGAGVFSSQGLHATLLTPSAIRAHYLAQMVAEGWKYTGGIDEAGSVSAVRLTSQSTAGKPITALLVLTALPGSGTLDGWLRVLR